MKSFETDKIEYTVILTDKILKEIIAFANVSGGVLYIGVDDSGQVVGLDSIDEQYTRLTNMIRDGICPDITMFVSSTILSENELNYIKLDISVGTRKPYYLRSKGLRPEGVYVRQGASSVPTSMERIREMIKQTDGIKYETTRSLNQDLTFIYASEVFSAAGVTFGEPQFLTLGIKSTDGLFTNLGLLLSDQCPYLIKAASFWGTSRARLRYRKELCGSVLKQAEDALQFATMGLPTHTYLAGVRRIDAPAVAIEAIREGIYNALVHRDYGIDGPTMLSVFDDRIEVASIGGIVLSGGISALVPGISICRNKALADVFYRLGLIEAYGTGLPKIAETYTDSMAKYSIDVTESTFRIILPYKPEILKNIAETASLVQKEEATKTLFFDNNI